VIRRALVTAVCAAAAASLVACSSSSSPAPSGGAGTTGQIVNVKASEFRFDPASISVPAGSVSFHVTNVGSVEHEFEVFKGDQAVGEVEGLVPGLEKDLTLQLAAGDYTIACKLPGHFEQGMKGTLTVTT
jgi:iron uptake system component EfeO